MKLSQRGSIGLVILVLLVAPSVGAQQGRQGKTSAFTEPTEGVDLIRPSHALVLPTDGDDLFGIRQDAGESVVVPTDGDDLFRSQIFLLVPTEGDDRLRLVRVSWQAGSADEPILQILGYAEPTDGDDLFRSQEDGPREGFIVPTEGDDILRPKPQWKGFIFPTDGDDIFRPNPEDSWQDCPPYEPLLQILGFTQPVDGDDILRGGDQLDPDGFTIPTEGDDILRPASGAVIGESGVFVLVRISADGRVEGHWRCQGLIVPTDGDDIFMSQP
jgi:hypothetical protein